MIKRLLLPLLCIIVLCSASINKMYVQRQGDFGLLLYVFSQKMPSTDKKLKALQYDYTYIEQTDSVSVLSTLTLPTTLKPAEATVTVGDSAVSYPLEVIYIEPKGKQFEYRLRYVIPMSKWENMYQSESPFRVDFTLIDNQNRSKTYTFSYSAKDWRKNRQKMEQIIYIAKLNIKK